MVALSFATNGSGSSTIWSFTLENYKKIAEPVYLKSFVQSFQLAITSTLLIVLMGILSDILWRSFLQNGRNE